MTESELIQALARRTDVSTHQARAMVDALADIIHQCRHDGESLPLSSFGAFCSEPCKDWGEKLPEETDMNLATPPSTGRQGSHISYQPDIEEVRSLIRTAEAHPLGVDFLVNGELCAVAVTFQSHAFTVEAARKYLDETNAIPSPLPDRTQPGQDHE